jgi:hypothetical protein
MSRFRDHARRNAVAYVALFVALGGTSYAATQLPANSVGAAQIRNHVIGPVKLSPQIAGTVAHWAHVSAQGKVLASSGGAKVVHDPWNVVSWGAAFSSRCVPLVTLEFVPGPTGTNGFAEAGVNGNTTISVRTFDASGNLHSEPYYVALICP